MSGPTSTGSSALLDQVRRVAVLRQEADRFSDALAQRRHGFETANAGLINVARTTKEKLAEEELRLRDMTVAEFKATGEKKPAPGVSIRQTVDLIYQEDQAFDWAKKMQMALKLDRKQFDAIAKASELDFVQKVDTAAATIATDLASALAAAEVLHVQDAVQEGASV